MFHRLTKAEGSPRRHDCLSERKDIDNTRPEIHPYDIPAVMGADLAWSNPQKA